MAWQTNETGSMLRKTATDDCSVLCTSICMIARLQRVEIAFYYKTAGVYAHYYDKSDAGPILQDPPALNNDQVITKTCHP